MTKRESAVPGQSATFEIAMPALARWMVAYKQAHPEVDAPDDDYEP